MLPNSKQRSLDYWQQSGQYVLMAMPYADEVLVEARGCHFRDADGRDFLDLASGMFCCVLGHNHPSFVERLSRQIAQMVHSGTQFLTPAVLEASRKLAEITPGQLQKSILLSTGTEANEFAFRLAKTYTGRTGIIGFSRGYYGTSLATRSCSSLSSHHLRDCLPTTPETVRLPLTPQCIRCFTSSPQADCEFPCLDSLDSSIGDWSNIAAVIVEPVLSAGGMLFPPSGYLEQLKKKAHDRGALLIVDEAQTGFGRTGRWFAIEHHSVEPDILSLSKSLGNGFPVSAVITNAEIADKVVAEGLWNLSSHQSDPISAAAICAVIDTVKAEGLVERAQENGEYFMQQLRDLASRQPRIGGIRGKGLMIGFDICGCDSDEAIDAANRFMYGCRSRGVHLTYGYGSINIRIIPPLTITRAEIDFAVEVMERSLREEVQRGDSMKELWPKNPHTRRLFDRSGRRLMNHLWRSSPQKWVEKGTEMIRERLGVSSR